ncbi:thioredoxin family protein [Cellulomonas iranensis]|uniref:thioredoxin family protein n=1 Tax=Cellulomonas iranensis TaxID=76862 RepID=UPI000B3C14B6|nr:thioredoxin family protein [Cellulomonas iranensis]
MRGPVLVLAVLALASVIGLVWRARNGRFRASGGSGSAADDARDARLGVEDLGVASGERATFVQLSSEVCAACRSTHRVLSAVAATEPGVVHVELDAAQRLDLVERFGVLRTPTTLVLGPDGAVVGRMSGATDRAQALAALASCPRPRRDAAAR